MNIDKENQAIAELQSILRDDEETLEIWHKLFKPLSPIQRAEAVFSLVGPMIDPDSADLTKEGKIFAIEVADVMGPDYTQGVYKFGVHVGRAV